MSLGLSVGVLLSRKIRANAAAGKTGSELLNAITTTVVAPRKITSLTKLKAEESGGLIQNVWNAVSKFAGFIGGLIKAVAFSATKIWGWVVGAIERLKSFNWNATDEELKTMVDAQNLRLAGLWGGVVGQGFGWLAGIGVGYGVAFLCPVVGGAALARLVATKVGKEAMEELLPTLRNALAQTAGAVATSALIGVYTNYRRFLKNAPEAFLNTVFGADSANFIKNVWGAKGGPDMSFNHQMDEAIENIQNKALQEFLEEFFDEAWDSFTEAGFIVAQEIDEAFAQHKASQKELLGPERTIEIIPDREAEDESLKLIQMPQQLALPAIQQTINTQRLLYNRDVGEVIGTPAASMGRANFQLRQLVIVFQTRPEPPWVELTGKRCKRVEVQIPDLKVGVSWEDIKTAANPYDWGRFRATANMNNRRQMAVYGATAQEAETKLRKLALLSTSDILTLSISEEQERPEKLKKRPTRVYPTYATLINRHNTIDGQGRTSIDNRTYDEKTTRFALWTVTEPRNFPTLTI
ncbi:MAG: hypothetical protein KME45_27345 [Stenomitos rutilans HA7619-LM2]|jgi:hypothetical protein|nr:hypothetical protein [Stenomitos rutilans HA7619-LM2]